MINLSSNSFGRAWLPTCTGVFRAVALAVGLALGGLALLVAPARAQEQGGTISGQVVVSETLAPIASAQVHLEGTGTGTLTGSNGRYILLNVPAGSYTLVVQRIGFGTLTQEVTVQAGQSQTLDFELEQQVLGLDELVVTGEAGAARQREVGHAVSQLNIAQVNEPPVNMEQLLQGRVPGLSITEASGSSGSGSMIRLRGNVSVEMSNQPLIYIDGVRVRSELYPENVPPVGYEGRGANITPSPLNDIDPSNIERIEVVKGAAATTLYGTEAAAGVIQIFTKQGAAGATRWTFQIDQGFSWLWPFGTDAYPYVRLDPWLRGAPSWLGGGIADELVAETNADLDQNEESAYNRENPWEPGYLGTAHRQRYYLSASGGSDLLTYFVSGSWSDNEGVLPHDEEESLRLRGNFGFSPLDDLNVQWSTGLALSNFQNTPSGNNAHGITLQAYRFNRNYVSGYLPDRVDQVIDYQIDTRLAHLTSGLTATYQATPAFSHRLAVGYDRAESETRNLRPFGYILAPGGILASQPWVAETVTLDYSGNYRLDLTGELGATASWGGQAIETDERSVDGYSEQFSGPGEPTLSSGAVASSFEDRIRVINAGFFGQVRFDWRDRLFLTAGLRVDGNSAFGQNLGLEPYPKVSASYVMSDAAWWPSTFGTVKLRAALGQSGRAPGAFDAVRTWEPVRLGENPGLLPENLGNPDLGPERTTEYELGFDGSFLDDRLTALFTYYYRRTSDALLPVRQIPSLGGWEDQLQNMGTLTNRGFELDVNGTVIQRQDLGLDLGVAIFTNHSEMVDLGGAPAFTVGGNAWVMEGEPVPVLRGDMLLNPGEIGEPDLVQDTVFGPNQPTLVVTPRLELRFLNGFRLSAYGEYQGGFYLIDGPSANAISRGVIWPYCDTPEGNASELIDAGNMSGLTARTRFLCNWDETDGDRYIVPGDFFKLRNVTLQIPLDSFFPWGSTPTLALSARNTLRWFNDEWFSFDPEMLGNSGANNFERSLTEHVPPASTFTASLRVNF